MSIFADLNREAYDREYSDRELMRRIASYFAPHGSQLVLLAALIVGLALVGAAQPLVVARALDRLADEGALRLVLWVVGLVLAFGIFNWLANWLRRRMMGRVIADVVAALRRDAFDASVRHDMSFFDAFQSGRIISRITSDTEEFAQVSQLVTDLLSQLTQMIFLLALLFNTSWRLALLVLVMMPVVLGFAMAFRRVARKVTRRGFQVLAEVNAAIQEAVTGIGVAKSFRQEQQIYDEFTAVNEQSYAVNLRRGFTLGTVFPTLAGLSGIGMAILVYWGGLSAAAGSISIGNWYLFINSVDRFWFPMMNISAFWSQLQAGLSAAERVFALIDAEPTVSQLRQEPVQSISGDIQFDNVSFAYDSDEEWVLRDFVLHMEAGESVALVGHTGAGKSSIAKLIARFYEFQEGRILIDGRDIRTLDLTAYRRCLGIVSQMPFLFAGSVADNVRYANSQISDDEIVAMAQQIGDGTWLDTLPSGLATNVGERGGRLSMGQRQLVALMRVLVQSPGIFILDEATASIDPFTEAQIQEATHLILRRSTSILIAHRLSTVRAVDRIIVLREGAIIEEGSHDSLLARGGHYADLYNTYFRHQSLEYVEEVGRRRVANRAESE
jgi:ATP-binding cassette subfamily B protein